MGRNPHPDYLFKIQSDFSTEQINDISSIDKNTIYVVKTVYLKNDGNYTYSNHYILNTNLEPTTLKIGNVSIMEHVFFEYLTESHKATIDATITDKTNRSRTEKFSHANGLEFNSDIDGQGIHSIVKIINLAQKINHYESWALYDEIIGFKKRLGAKVLFLLGWNYLEELIEEDDAFCNKILDEYNERKFENLGIIPKGDKEEYLKNIKEKRQKRIEESNKKRNLIK